VHDAVRTLRVYLRVRHHHDGRAALHDSGEHIHHGITVRGVEIPRLSGVNYIFR
jgi:hypothetical protein